jgi:tRNA A37 N6-isopentenylltransferase MiaA
VAIANYREASKLGLKAFFWAKSGYLVDSELAFCAEEESVEEEPQDVGTEMAEIKKQSAQSQEAPDSLQLREALGIINHLVKQLENSQQSKQELEQQVSFLLVQLGRANDEASQANLQIRLERRKIDLISEQVWLFHQLMPEIQSKPLNSMSPAALGRVEELLRQLVNSTSRLQQLLLFVP